MFQKKQDNESETLSQRVLALLQGLAETDGNFTYESMIGYSMLEAVSAFSLGTHPSLTHFAEDCISNKSRPERPTESVKAFAQRLLARDSDRLDVHQLGGSLRDFLDHTKYVARHYSPKVLYGEYALVYLQAQLIAL